MGAGLKILFMQLAKKELIMNLPVVPTFLFQEICNYFPLLSWNQLQQYHQHV
jgi:hypothetical protein